MNPSHLTIDELLAYPVEAELEIELLRQLNKYWLGFDRLLDKVQDLPTFEYSEVTKAKLDKLNEAIKLLKDFDIDD